MNIVDMSISVYIESK